MARISSSNAESSGISTILCLSRISFDASGTFNLASKAGALGAKLTGGGGAMIALCPEHPEKVVEAIEKAGYQAIVTSVG